MSGEPRIGFATLCKGRAFHLKETLPRNLKDVESYPNAFCVILDYESQDDLIPYLKANHSSDIESGKLVVYSYRNGGAPLKLAHGKNLAMRCAILEGAELVCQMDADNWGGAGFTKFISDIFREPGMVPGIFAIPDYHLIKSLPHGKSRPVRGYAGRLVCWAQTFIKMGGYAEEFEVWGSEDICTNFRLQRAGYQIRHIPNHFLNAINHSAAIRFKEYPNAQQFENDSQVEILKAKTNTVVNYGQFGLGKVYRNFSETAIELRPLPTRVFGIGVQRTGTTSLHEAFKMLGFDSLHWGTGEAPLIWYEMNALGRSKTLEQWYALCDFPIPLLYQKLDKAYPGSKFVLTIRNESDWLESVRKLWDYKTNPHRYLWEIYPISHQLHTAFYGQKEFDAAKFVARYRQHNAEVLEYFSGRPDDLLILDMDRPRGKLAALCKFLDMPSPTTDGLYPRANRSTESFVPTT